MTTGAGLEKLGVAEAARRIRAGEISAEELTRAHLAQIDRVEGEVQAWIFLDPDHALRQARAADEWQRQGRPLGSLHGVPVGIKDIIDTADMPTENGSPLHAGRRPAADAAAVAALRQAGAVIMGKTVTTEFASFHPGKTRNPHDPRRTPGGSSSGSAAAVAARMVPAALGSQTNGSVIRPASFCGVVGFKPTHGLISRRGVFMLSRPLDHVGVMARSVGDAALVADAMAGFDPADPDTRMQARPALFETAMTEPPAEPRLAFVRTPVWDNGEPAMHAAFAGLVKRLGARVREVALPASFDEAVALHTTIVGADMTLNLAREYAQGRSGLSTRILEILDRGQNVRAVDYNAALHRVRDLNAALEDIFSSFDAIVTPPAAGEAPMGLEATGTPIFCTTWSLLGVPAVTMPLLAGAAGLPIGAQLVGRRGEDGRLLRTARWLADMLAPRA